MADNKEWQVELEEYIRQGEPDEIEKSNAWKTAMKHLLPIHGTLEMHYDLNNRYMHIDYVSKSAIQSAKMAL